MVLSEENYNLLNEYGLYKKEPIKDESYHTGSISGTFWCKNWTFRVQKREGKAVMVDTYWNSLDGSNNYEVTDENINEFQFIFDFREVRHIRDTESNEYDPEDLFEVATDSGGYTCGNLYWVKKSATKSRRLLIEKKEKEIESLRWQLEQAEIQLKRLKDVSEYAF